MSNRRHTNWRLWVLLVPLVSLVAPWALAQDSGNAPDDVEELVITGSHLKRKTADSPSPLSVVTRADIEDIGAMDIKDITKDLTYSSGSLGGSSSPFYGGDSSTGNASLNMRNLGSGATLVLVNGKRVVNTDFDLAGSAYVNVQGILPTVAIERVEILKDGSSALYGSDAVAGVVNFVTRQNFEGIELNFDYAVDSETGKQNDESISMIVGVAGDQGNISVSGSYLNRDELNMGDRYERYGKSGISTFGQPGRYVPLAGITADTTGTMANYFMPGGSTEFGGRADPDCDLAAADDGPMGVLGTVGADLCIYDFSSFFALVQPSEVWKAHADANYEINDKVRLKGSASYYDSFSDRNNSLYPDVSFATIGASHFGNQLDAARRGVNPVTLLALQRMMGGQVNSSLEDRPITTRSTYERNYLQVDAGAEIDLQGSWTLNGSIGYSQSQFMGTNPSDTLTTNVNAAYVGLGGPDCNVLSGTAGSGNLGTGDCYYYNNFGTSVYDPVTNLKWDAADTNPWAADPALTVQQAALKYQNPTELYEWMQGEISQQITRSQTVIDIVAAGDIWELESGTVGLAVGLQYRKDETRDDIDAASNNNNFKFIYGAEDWQNKLTTYAAFVELWVPVAPWAEMQIAGRYENFDELDENSFDPKVTLLLRPMDGLTLRGSAGTSFRVGSLLQTGGKNTALLNSTDPISGTGGLAFRPTLTSGNAGLSPEESTMFNIGLSWIPEDGPLDGLAVNLDYYNYDYTDLISREGHQDLINQDNELRCPNGLNDDPLAGALCGVSDQDGDGVDEFYSVGAGIPDKVIRRADGGLLRTEASYFNAPSLDTSGIDMTVSYDFDWGDLGSFQAMMTGTYTISYDIVDDKGVNIDGVGSRNAGNSIGRPLPKYKMNWSLRWLRDQHSVIATVRHVDGYDDDVPQSALRGSYGFTAPQIDSWTTLDVQYSVRLPGFGNVVKGSTLSLGMKNATNETPPLMNVDGGYDYFTHDPRGRIIYGRISLSL